MTQMLIGVVIGALLTHEYPRLRDHVKRRYKRYPQAEFYRPARRLDQ